MGFFFLAGTVHVLILLMANYRVVYKPLSIKAVDKLIEMCARSSLLLMLKYPGRATLPCHNFATLPFRFIISRKCSVGAPNHGAQRVEFCS